MEDEQTTTKKRILLVDDHVLVRQHIKRLLDGYFTICGEAGNGREALEKTIAMKPDLVILDVFMPVMNGLDAVREMRTVAPETKILLLSIHDLRPLEKEAKSVGADAFLSKSDTKDQLIRVIEQLAGTTR